VSSKKICGRPLKQFLGEVEKFHGWKAPGILIGGFMVDWGLELLGGGVEFDAIVETSHCLPDAVQIFTPCTIGNGWMKILDWDKFAISFYGRRTLGEREYGLIRRSSKPSPRSTDGICA
jgi:formylmethanofuran dehydrogenase subunit E